MPGRFITNRYVDSRPINPRRLPLAAHPGDAGHLGAAHVSTQPVNTFHCRLTAPQTSTGCLPQRCWAARRPKSPCACWPCCPSSPSPSSASEPLFYAATAREAGAGARLLVPAGIPHNTWQALDGMGCAAGQCWTRIKCVVVYLPPICPPPCLPQLQRAPHRPQPGALFQPPHDDGHPPRGVELVFLVLILLSFMAAPLREPLFLC